MFLNGLQLNKIGNRLSQAARALSGMLGFKSKDAASFVKANSVSSDFNPVSFGPLLGDVSATSIRVWSALTANDSTLEKPNIGRIRYRKFGEQDWSEVIAFRYNSAFQYTGVVVLTGLTAGRRYEYQVGIVVNPSLNSLDWQAIPINTFSTLDDTQASSRFSFALGSCLYPRNSFVSINNSAHGADKSFKHAAYWNRNDKLSMMILMGDQIYADTGNMFDAATNISEYVKHYHRLYSGEYFANAVANIPTYMIMDDHEIHNDFTDGAQDYIQNVNGASPQILKMKRKINHARYINGLATFNAFQAVHGKVFNDVVAKTPVHGFVKGHQGSDVVSQYYYDKRVGDYDFFFTDTRLERRPDRLISCCQRNALIKWLKDSKAKVKFVVSAVTFLADKGPNAFGEKDPDNWEHDTASRAEILKTIVEHDIKNVVFLSGDIHASFMASAMYNGQAVPIHQIVCSGLYWPVGGVNGMVGGLFRWQYDDVNFGSDIAGAEGFTLGDAFSETDTIYYCGNGIGRIDVSDNQLTFSVAARRDDVGAPYRLIAKVDLID